MLFKDLKYSINSWITPSVLIISSPSVGKIFQKSGNTSLEQVFAQYILEKKKVNVKVHDQTYEMNDFKVNFISPQYFDQQTQSQILKDTASSIDSLATDEYYPNFKLRSKQDVQYFNKICSEPTPWFEKYRYQFIKSLHNLDLETFTHPIAIILATSSEDSNPIGLLVKMFDSAKPPPIFQQLGIEAANIPKIYMLVHPDNSHAESEKRLGEMKQTFGSSQSYLLRVNTKEDHCGLGYDHSTAHLNPLAPIINDILSKHIPVYFEKAIGELNENIATNKKSFFSKVKAFRFGGKKTNESESDSNSPNNSSTVEQSLRKVGDLYFLLQDYENALSNYKTLAKEFNSDKSPNFYASANEMIGLCNYMMNKESESYFEIAYNNYIKGSLVHCAARVAMIHGYIMKKKSNFKGVSDLFKQTAEIRDIDPFCSAILWEQAGFSLLHTTPSPLFRKATMRIVMAGDKYSEAAKRKHALRCYSFSYSVYEGRDWNLIDDHLHLSLVRYSFFQGNTSDAILFVNKLLEKNCQTFQKQNSIIREFLYISKNYGTNKENYIGELPIPSIHNESISVHLNDYSPDGSQSVWQEMEEAFKKEAQVISKPLLQGFDLWKRDLYFETEKERTAVVEEQITVEVEIKNPLQIPLQFNRVHLVATYKENDASNTDGAIEESNMSPLDDENMKRMMDGSTPFKVEPLDILLLPTEVKKITFSIQPMRPGLLQVKGLGLCMCGAVWGKREFKLKQKRLNKTRQQRESVVYEQNLSLTFRVTSPMPRLEAQFLEFPDALYHGELRQAKLQLKNCSNKMGLKNVRVRLSHPTSVCFGSNSNDASVVKSLDKSVYLDVSLPPNATVTVPCWVRGMSVGRHTLRCLVYYESEAGNTDLKYRLARCQTQFDVRPSIRISSLSQQSCSGLNSYLLGVEVDNPIIGGGGDSFNLKQISSISNFWKIEPLSYNADVPNPSIVSLNPGQFTNLFFRIEPSEKNILKDNQNQKDISITNISFYKNEPMYDSSSFPIYNFLEYEKLNHELQQQQQQQQNQQSNNQQPQQQQQQPQISHQQSQQQLLLNNYNNLNDNNPLIDNHPNQIDLLIYWECNNNNRMGVLNSPNISFLPTHYSDSSLSMPWGSWKNTTSPSGKTIAYPSLKLPLRYKIKSQHSIKHNFENDRFCTVPLKLSLSNCSFVHPLQLSIETLLPHENIDQTTHSTSQYFWTGATKYNIELKPQEITDLQLHCCFTKFGVYNINRFKINVKLSNEIHKEIYSTIQHLINIEP
ncbi:hypothetical protein DICPUDRAFT_36746 [Dictyostelium purpureum]|uniref:Trafficking protein particle complex subunit 8 n=1 Tax=Dictyostelium purpureum TaxID=5786 RepID=F0ZRK9_DICPU|nr:uncharacterized protein DICPUDRAFT_36746 [Dictyostelium purpureum]EGC33425.1 hypothetical protein DICPUDRAFT_36746 [Dictyostelium purpureum]|eukprot:XP_003290044.1 hypothetical protein DICPUDRAFT_36746 [Dictyostelium purpureum]